MSTYKTGASVRQVAQQLQVHRTTILHHLVEQGVPRRPHQTKLTKKDITTATKHYQAGASLQTVGKALGVDASTVRKALARAGVAIRPRRGWVQPK